MALASVVSQTTTRLDAPSPVTYALTDRYFELASISNIFSWGMCRPARTVTSSIFRASSGCPGASGVNRKNSGSTTSGVTKIRNTRIGSSAIQNQSHQRRGLLRRIA